ARRSVEEGAPEPLDCSRVEADRSDGLRVAQGLVHGSLQAAPDPTIERQHKTALGPLEQRRIKTAQADTSQHVLASKRLVARLIRQAIHALEQALVHQRPPLLQR